MLSLLLLFVDTWSNISTEEYSAVAKYSDEKKKVEEPGTTSKDDDDDEGQTVNKDEEFKLTLEGIT